MTSAIWRSRLLLLAISFALVLILGEIAARIVERADRAARTRRAAPATTNESGKPVFDGVLEIARPNVDGIHNGVPFRTNSRGVRGPEISARADVGVTRILIVGDSVTMGSGVLEQDAYAMQVVPLLGRPVESVNGGLSGLNAGAVMDRLEKLDAAYAPNLLVYGFTINDIEGPAFQKAGNPGAVVRLWQRAARYEGAPSALVRQLWPRWVMLQERLDPTLGDGDDAYVRNYAENPRAWGAIEAALDRLAATAGDRCAAVLIHTHLKRLDEAQHAYLPVYDKVEAAAGMRGLHPIPTFPTFANRRVAPLWVSFLDPHPSREGHALLAAALAEGLAGLPDACWRDGAPGRP